MDGGWLPSTLGLPPPIKRHATPKPPTEARQHNEHGVTVVPGELGSVRLDVKNAGSRNKPKELRLKFFANHDPDAKLQELRLPARVFPDSRAPEPDGPDASVLQRTEQGKKHLDNHPALMHIPFELAHSQVRAVVAEAEAVQPVFDPYVGNCLASTWARSSLDRSQSLGLLIFPMGEVGHKLNISPINWTARSRHQNDVFAPCAQSVAEYTTPIQQIVASPYDTFNASGTGIQNPTLAVRTIPTTKIMQVGVNHAVRASDRTSPASVTEFTTITTADTNHRRHVDVALSHSSERRALIVDDEGAMYEYEYETKKSLAFCERRFADVVETAVDGRKPRRFYRVTYGSFPQSANLLSSHALRTVDLRTRDSETLLYSLAGSTSMFTSLEQRMTSLEAFDTPLVCFSTTESISWVDARMPGRAVVKWEHGRAFDRSLEVVSTESAGVATTFLTSRLTNLTTAYTLNVSNPSVPASIHDPYVLAPPVSTSPSHRPFARAGTTFFRHPSIPAERDELSLFELSDLGGLVMRKLGRITEDPADVAERMKGALRAGREGFQWQPDITHLAKTTEKEAHSDPVNHREAREVKLVDMRKRYEDVFRLPRPVKLGIKFEVVDRMEQLFTELDHPLEEMVTPHNIALLAGTDEPPAHRSDFIAASAFVPPAPGTLQAIADRLAARAIGKHSAFHHSVVDRIQSMLGRREVGYPSRPPITFATAQAAADHFRADYGYGQQHAGEPDGREAKVAASNACDVVALDLALSADVYSAEPITAAPSTDADELLAQATRALSLGRAPELTYAYFRPVVRPGWDDFGEDELCLEGSATARILLSKWVIGEDPVQYKHQDLRHTAPDVEDLRGDPMDADDESGPDDDPHSSRPSQSQGGRPRHAPPIIASSQPQPQPFSSQRPPVIASTFEIPARRPALPIISIRSPSRSRASSVEPNVPSSSFDPQAGFAASQPLPSRRTSGGGGASSSQPQGRGGPSRLAFGSSQSQGWGIGMGMEDADGDSQMMDVPSTQVVPGAFGGKLGGGKKSGAAGKKPKKRTGGF